MLWSWKSSAACSLFHITFAPQVLHEMLEMNKHTNEFKLAANDQN